MTDLLLSSKDLMVKVVQNIPTMLVYVPSQLNVHSQVSSHSQSHSYKSFYLLLIFFKCCNMLCKPQHQVLLNMIPDHLLHLHLLF